MKSPVQLLAEKLAALREVLTRFTGVQQQLPPMYSAVKIGGRKLYELARAGKESERKPREITVFSLDLLDFSKASARLRIHCSKGTYIRTLCNDIGEKLGVGGCMKGLLRTRVGRFAIGDSLTLGELQKLKDEGRLSEALLPLESVFADYPGIRAAEPETDRLVRNGNPFRMKTAGKPSNGDARRVYAMDGTFIGIYEYSEEKRMFYPRKIFLG